MSRILVISPHPDDESINCGGTLRRHVTDGDAVRVVFLTSGEKGGGDADLAGIARLREEEARCAARILELEKIEFWQEPDGALTVYPKLMEHLRKALKEWGPDVVYITHSKEMHSDHKAAFRLVRTALAGLPKNRKPAVWMYEVWTPIQKLDRIVDISDVIRVKEAAVKAHRSQCSMVRFDEAVLALARYRGEMHSWPGGDYAEVFERLTVK